MCSILNLSDSRQALNGGIEMNKWRATFSITVDVKEGMSPNRQIIEDVECENRKDVKKILMNKYPTFTRISCTKAV